MASVHPHVIWRDDRPRFQPSPQLRDMGLKGTDLRWPLDPPQGWKIADLQPGDRNEGRWFSMGEAVDWSAAFVRNLQLARKRMRKTKPAAPAAPRPAPVKAAKGNLYTVGTLFHEWQQSAKFRRPDDPAEKRKLIAARIIYADNTVADFRHKARRIENHDPNLWAAPVDALTQPVMVGLYEEMCQFNGIASARGAMATFSVALSWGKRRGKFTFRENMGINPALDLGMATPAPRIRFGTRDEIETLVKIADHMDRPEIGDMVILGVWTGQRQADRMELEDRGLLNRRRIFRQNKTGAIVAVLESPDLKRRLLAAEKRRRGARAQALLACDPEDREKIERRFRRVVLNELRHAQTKVIAWQPYEGKVYTRAFAEIREAAVKGVRAKNGLDWLIKPCPSLADFHDADLRDTAVTWMALAGATIPEIISVTGHTAASANTILKHYLAQHPEMADAAIGKMMAWFDAGGETEIGL